MSAEYVDESELMPIEGPVYVDESELMPIENRIFSPTKKSWKALQSAFSGDPLSFVDNPQIRMDLKFSTARLENPDEERKRWALAAYFAQMRKGDIQFCHANLDLFIKKYYEYDSGKEMSVDAAYNDISGMFVKAGLLKPEEQQRGSRASAIFKGGFSSLLSTLSNLGATMLEGSVQLNNADRRLDGMKERAEKIHKDFNRLRDITAGYYKDIAEEERGKILPSDWATVEGAKKYGVSGTARHAILAVLFEAPNMGAQALAGAANPALIPVLMGVTTANDKAYQLDTDNAEMGELAKAINILTTGTINGALEKVTMGIMKGAGLKLDTETLKAGFREGVKYYLKSTGKEAGTELAEQLGENLTDLLTGVHGDFRKMDRGEVRDILSSGLAESAIVGGAYGAGFAGMGHRSLRKLEERRIGSVNALEAEKERLLKIEKPSDEEIRKLNSVNEILDAGDSRRIAETAEAIAQREAEAEARREAEDAEKTVDDKSEDFRESYHLRKEELAHNPQDTEDAVIEESRLYPAFGFETYEGAENMPPEARREALRLGYSPQGVDALISGDTCYVNTARLRPSDVPKRVLEEVAGHRGLRAVFGEQYDSMLDGVYRDFFRQEEFQKIAGRYFQEGELDSSTENQRYATEEFLAHNARMAPELKPSWWKEFLQKIKMALRKLPGFQNLRFTDRELERILMRGIGAVRGNKAYQTNSTDGDVRFAAALRRDGAPNTADQAGQLRDSNVPHRNGFMEEYGFGGKGLYADYEFLFGRHPEYFEDAEHARAAVEFVLDNPENAGRINGNLAFIRKDESNGKIYRIELNPRQTGKRHQIRSVHEITELQYKKTRDRLTRSDDTASPDPVRQGQKSKAGGHPNMKNPGLSVGNRVSDFLRYDSTENGNVKFSTRFSLNQYSDADWTDMVGYMKAKVGTLLTKPDADYRRILEEAGMECFSDADAHAIAAAAAAENQRDAQEFGRIRRDKWIYENESMYRQVIEFAGKDDFKLVPDQWEGESFTGTWIAPEYVKYSEKRPQGKTESDRKYQRYLKLREKKLKSAKGYRIDEVAEAIARKTGGDMLEIQEQLVDYFRDLKKPDLYHKYAEWRKQSELSNRDLQNNLREEWEELQYSHAEEAIIDLLENGREITRGWISANRLAYKLLYERTFKKEAPRNLGKKDFEDLNAALKQKRGDMATFAAGIKEGRRILSGEYLKKLSDFKEKVCNDWNNIRDIQYAAKEFAYEHVDKGFREKFISGIIGLSRFSAKPSKAYPDGRRQYEFDQLCKKMAAYQKEVRKDKALQGIQELLKQNRSKRTDKNVAFSPMGERQTALDRISHIVRMSPETVAGCMQYALKRKTHAEELKNRLGDSDGTESDPERDRAVLESTLADREIFYLNHFGGLKLKETDFVVNSYELLKKFVKDGRFEYQAQIEKRAAELDRKRQDAIREMAAGKEDIPSGRDLDRSINPVSDYLYRSESIIRLFDVLSRTSDGVSLDSSHAGRMIRMIEDSTHKESTRLNRLQTWFDTTLAEECDVSGIVAKGRFLNGAMKEETVTVDGKPVTMVQYGTLLGDKEHKVAHWDMGRPRRKAWMHIEHCRKMLEDLNAGTAIEAYAVISDLEQSKKVRSGLREAGIRTGRFYSVCRTRKGFRIYTENESGLTESTDLPMEAAPPVLTALLEDEDNLLPVSDIMRYGAQQQILEYDAGATEHIYKGLGDEVDESSWKAFQEGEGRARRVELMTPGKNVITKNDPLKLSPGAAMELILLWEQDHYRPGMEWNGYSEETISQLKRWLDSKHKGYLKFAYAMRKFLAEEHAELDEAVFRRYGVHLPETKNFFYGDFSGSVGNRISDAGFGNPSGGMTVNATFLTARRFHLTAPDTHSNAISLFMRKQLEQNHFICWTETLRELRGIYGNRSVQNVMVKEFGQEMWNNLREKIEVLASNGSSPDKAAKYLAHFYKSWAPGNIALNASSILKQFAGGSAYGLYVPTHKLLKYLPEANPLNKEYRAFLAKQEVVNFCKNRMAGGVDPNMAGLLNYTRRGGAVSTLNEAGLRKLLYPQLFSDKLTALTFGYAAYRYFYEQGRKKKMSIRDADDYAIRMWERATDETQQSGALKDQNHFTSNPGVWRYLTTFMTNPMQTAALELTAWQKFLKDRNWKNFGVLTHRIVVNHLVNTTLMNLVSSLLRHGFNVADYLDEWDDYAAGWLFGSFDALWLFGKGAMMIKEGLSGSRYASDMSAVPMISDLARDAGTMTKIAKGDEVEILDWMKISGDALMSAGPGFMRLPGILLYSLSRQGKRWKRLLGKERTGEERW